MKRIYNRILSKSGMSDPSTRSLVSRVLATSTYGVIVFSTMGTLGVDTSPLLATLGVTGATIGFACKDIGANAVAGVSLAWQKPFSHGSYVSIGIGGSKVSGVVDHWDMRYLYLRGEGGELIHVPNSIVFNTVITIEDRPTATSTDPAEDKTTKTSAASATDAELWKKAKAETDAAKNNNNKKKE